jgi:glycine/D-amino acid oxidase-like deaminating enzyme
VEVRLRTRALSISAEGLRLEGERGEELLQGAPVFNCTYSALNELLERSGLDLIPLRHELTEMLLIEPPEELRHAAVTVMCGPFFSTMPFPALGLHSFSHVRYTPHVSWEERTRAVAHPTRIPRSNAVHMLKDAQRYLPLLSRARTVRSFFEVKTILPQCEGDDSRPILFKRSARLPHLISVMGGKIDNVYDLPRELSLAG